MAECKHEFIGKADGVHCKKCGIILSALEYARYMNPEIQEKPKPKWNGGKKVKNNE